MSDINNTGYARVFLKTTMGLDTVGRIQLCNTVKSLNKHLVYFDNMFFIVNKWDRC